ncbi:uncharacterized protein LOC117905533 isoform X2 [Vitis riparia]|uniref:uncharacterized protein LOC117905533 isoform X2 n=1 Tax=Vitis riparia TaxID=96939 RepID=UPI00155A5280|nr:uncharacterized protein LOC117905533 isoform X2 [Vitis riparia]
MEPITSVVDKLKGFAKSSHEFVNGLVPRRDRNPIEILKRLQREAFSDLMKLRDRQDKVERILSYKSSTGSPFKEANTHVMGEVDALGALLMKDNVDQQDYDAFNRAGMRTGIDSRFTFKTMIRQSDTLVAEFAASQKGRGYLVAVPVGAQCRDVGFATDSAHQGKGLTDFSSFGPPILNQHNGSAIGLMVRKSKLVASLAQFASGLGIEPCTDGIRDCFSTFGQVVCQLSEGTKLSLMGLHQVPRPLSQQFRLGALTMPVSILKLRKAPKTSVEASDRLLGTDMEERVSAGSFAVMLESKLDDSTRIGGWIEMKNSGPQHLQWALSVSDSPENEFGWSLSLGGIIKRPTSWDHFQAEASLKFNLGKRFSLQPGLVYVMDGNAQIPVVMLRSSWSL